MQVHPLRLAPILKPRVWGGRRLAELGRDLPPGAAIGESWELADLPERIPEGRSTVADGPWAGRTLTELIGRHGPEIMGIAALSAEGGFPLLIKYLDAARNLSVQVHPTPEYVERHPEADLKSEAWVVLRAEEGAVLYKGLRPGVDPTSFAESVRSGAVVDDLVAVPARPGDCHYLPSGTCHALGAGVLVAEVQTPSDTTFRVYDWGREGRELHVEAALECIDFDAAPETAAPGVPVERDGLRATPVLATEHFAIERLEARRSVHAAIVTDDQPVVWMTVAGGGSIHGGGRTIEVRTGDTVLVPAALTDASADLDAGTEVLEVRLPPPTKGMIA